VNIEADSHRTGPNASLICDLVSGACSCVSFLPSFFHRSDPFWARAFGLFRPRFAQLFCATPSVTLVQLQKVGGALRRGPEFARGLLSMAMGQAGAEVESRSSQKLACAFPSLQATTPTRPPVRPTCVHTNTTHVFCLAPVVIVVWVSFLLAPRWRVGPSMWDRLTTVGSDRAFSGAPSATCAKLSGLELPHHYLRHGIFDERTPEVKGVK
jgi:hypothetical protein